MFHLISGTNGQFGLDLSTSQIEHEIHRWVGIAGVCFSIMEIPKKSLTKLPSQLKKTIGDSPSFASYSL